MMCCCVNIWKICEAYALDMFILKISHQKDLQEISGNARNNIARNVTFSISGVMSGSNEKYVCRRIMFDKSKEIKWTTVQN